MIYIEKNFLKNTSAPASLRLIEKIFGCKWSLTVYQLLINGINRPGEMVRMVDGLTTKVLNECLRRNIEFGILSRQAFNEVPPRVEYQFTSMGQKLLAIIDALMQLQEEENNKTDEL